MSIRMIKVFLFVLVYQLATIAPSYAQVNSHEQHTMVAMRMVGHRLLLNAGDSVSLVMPVEKIDGRYLIQFDTELDIEPNELIATIDSVMQQTQITHSYVVEVEKCDTTGVFYSYEVGYRDTIDVIPCRTRVLPKACYKVWVSFDEEHNEAVLLSGSSYGNYLVVGLQVLSVVGLLGLVFYYWRKRQGPVADPDSISIGKYQLCKRKMELSFYGTRVELTSKEADLLLLLYGSVNNTIERETILKNVWGDEGDYVGRTLDVFISKLRKKLEADPDIKIVNARGVGYKLVVDL